jgi:hypothetical protein
MPPSAAFFVCCESGPLEQQTLLFARSLRRFGGRFADCAVHAYKPRTGPELEPATLAGFYELGIALHDEAINTEHHDYPFANKIYSGVAAERELGEEVIVFCDTDTVFLREPDALELPDGIDVAAAPAWHVNKASRGPGHEMEDYWQQIYELAGVTDPPWVETMEKGRRVRGYWNAGILATRRRAGLFTEWLELFRRLFTDELYPDGRQIVIDQVALAATISRRPDRLVNLDHTYNYDIGRRSFFKNEMRRIQLDELVQVHYHQWFNRRDFLREVRPRFETENERFRWLDEMLPLTPVIDAPIPRKKHKQKGVRGWLRKRTRRRALHRLRPTQRG